MTCGEILHMTTQLKKLNPSRTLLMRQSKEAKAYIKTQIDSAKSDNELFEALGLTVNKVLLQWHQEETGFKVFKTFADWKKEGFKIKKDEKCYRIWGKPRQVNKKTEVVDMLTDTTKEVTDVYELFPVCCLFHEGQVELLNDPVKVV